MTNTQRTKPNILLIMADQLSALSLPCYGNKVAKTPNIDKLVDNGIVFENNYCNFPLCAPSRASMMSGQLPTNIEFYDNGSEFKASVPTFAHFLRNEGYYTCLSGKMHFIGPEQLHGFEDRVTTEAYPADFSWTANWEVDARKVKSNEISGLGTVFDAGPYAWNMQMDYDEEVFFQGKKKLLQIAREEEKKPFCLCASFTAPHDPFITTREYWDLYTDDEIDMPKVQSNHIDNYDEHSQFLREMYNMDMVSEEKDIKNARRAYYSMISYFDEKIGGLIKTLEDTGLDENTIVIIVSDHGEMLGERGMWYKKTFFESVLRVPLIIYAPKLFKPKKININTSLVDVMPTIIDLCGCDYEKFKETLDGNSLVEAIKGNENKYEDIVHAEHTDSGTIAPRLMVKKGKYKYIWSEAYDPILYDLENDPNELKNIAGKPEYKDIVNTMQSLVEDKWDINNLKSEIMKNQKQRILASQALGKGRITNWEIGSTDDESTKYVRYGCKFPDIERKNYVPYSKKIMDTFK